MAGRRCLATSLLPHKIETIIVQERFVYARRLIGYKHD
jgi:hypothetical protein